MPTNKHPAPPKVRPKVGSKQTRSALLDVGLKYISSQPQGDPQNKLAPQIQQVTTTRTSLVALLGTRSGLQAQLTKNSGDIVVGDAAFRDALTGYAGAAGVFCEGDASLLSVLGVDQALARAHPDDEIIAMPVVRVLAGTLDGSADIKCARVPYAGAYLFEYKLEPSQPTDPWLGNVTTKLASTTVSGLAPAQQIRARARAIGVAPGPWSVEVVGRAK